MSVLEWDNLQTFVHDWMKGLQEIVDSIAPDPGEDNSMLPLASLPYKFDCTFYHTINTRSIIDGYESWDKGYGYQPWLYAFRLNLMNNQLRVVNQQWLGGKVEMGSPDRWGYLSNEDLETINAAGKAIIEGTPIVVDNSYPTNEIKTYGGNYGNISFIPLNHSASDIKYKFPTKDPNTTADTGSSSIGCVTTELPVFDENDGYWKPGYWGVYQTGGSEPNYSVYSKLIVVYESDTEAQRTVNTLAPYNTNNAVINYTKSGSEYKLYYGDNYLVYALNSSNIYNYQDLFTGTKQATDGINAWHPSDTPIKTPTYNEVKHEDDPPVDSDDIDEQDMGVGTNLGGLGGYWLLTKAQLADLHGALDNAPIGFDPLNSFISLIGLGVDVTKVLDATQIQYITPINIRMSDGTTWSTGVEGHIISSNEIVSAFNSDTFKIKRKYNNFLDYSPYATHELFIPMCGWVTLPDIAVDRNIYVTYLPDIESGKCRAVVSVVSNLEGDNDSCVIAEKDGIMASDVPFSNVGHSLFVGDAIINGANVAGEIITGAIGAGFTKSNAKGGTYRPYEGFTVGMGGTLPGAIGNALVSGNINRTHFMTGNSTKTGFSDGESIIVKSVYHIPDIPENYAHTVGLVCNKTGQLSEFNGFTVCDNPHITFSALEAEKEEIKRLLEEGVILPDGE